MLSELQDQKLHFLGDGIKEILIGPEADKTYSEQMYNKKVGKQLKDSREELEKLIE